MIHDPTLQIVRAEPDEEPVVFNWPRSIYAAWPWLTEEFMREVESG
ncbi:hypothetical protein [Streptomyces fulvorobeus]|uniref:Uncharacterized protein n=1 Tax=Streptomyces fulvorobeus TaxID=284028 RepID=A0A7Y9HGS2_9ACTN|nr:hypothetical protein [Streptomyces fulvorobeus]NYE44240.1 hypothetical protein [Streptomyces fulvorobeus]